MDLRSELLHPTGEQRRAQQADEVIARFMRAQHCRVRRAQLTAAGLTRGEIDGRIERGLLVKCHRGIYASSHAGPSRMHRDRIERDEITRVDRIPVTAAARTLRDCARLLSRATLDRMIDDAFDVLRYDRLTIDAVIARYPHHPGSVILRRAMADRGGATRSWLESRFTPLLGGLPQPLRNHPLRLRSRTIEADCFWPHSRLIVELDGRTYHERHAAFERDRQRDWDAAVAGYRTVRLTWLRLRDEPRQIRADLAELLAA